MKYITYQDLYPLIDGESFSIAIVNPWGIYQFFKNCGARDLPPFEDVRNSTDFVLKQIQDLTIPYCTSYEKEGGRYRKLRLVNDVPKHLINNFLVSRLDLEEKLVYLCYEGEK